MATHDIVAIGASAGGVEALTGLVRALPGDLAAAVLVVLHVPPYHPSHLPAILAHHGPLPAAHAHEGEAIVPGRIYVAPPGHHLQVRAGTVALTRGPHENHLRPAADVLFRTAARAYGPRVVGVVLSGTLSDGALGLGVIAARGGVAVVQDPAEALFSGMPEAALRAVAGAVRLPVARIGALLGHLAASPEAVRQKREREQMDESEDAESKAAALAMRDITAQAHDERGDQTTIYTCPECGGTLWQVIQNAQTQFRCHVGHAYGGEVLLGQMSEDVEAALWRSVRLLVEKATLTRQFARRLRAAGLDAQARRLDERAGDDDRQGQLIRDLLLNRTPAEAFTVAQALEEASSAQGSLRPAPDTP